MISFFFFQAEDGIRDLTVTGVQTCALPIWSDAASTRLTNSSVNESNSVSNVLISASFLQPVISRQARAISTARTLVRIRGDRKSTRLNSSHSQISYAVFCLKKKYKL